MNATFETIRRELKKYNAEDNEAPPKLVVAGKNSFLDLEHKRKRGSQFIMGVKEFFAPEKFLIEKMIDDLETRSGKRPLVFLYNERDAIETVIKDFEDYYNTPLSNDLFQKIESSTGEGDVQFYLIIVVLEIYYYESQLHKIIDGLAAMIPTSTLAVFKQMISHSFIDLTSRNTNENEEILNLIAKNEQYFKK